MGDFLDEVVSSMIDGLRNEPTRLTSKIDELLDSDPPRETIHPHRHSRDCRRITDACINLHCAACGRVVPAKGPTCGECWHVWRTRWHLLFAHWRVHLGIVWRDWRDPMSGPQGLAAEVGRTGLMPIPCWPPVRWYHLFGVFRCWRPGKVWVCPCCSHDL